MDTHTRPEDVELMTDRNESTCLNITDQNSTIPQLVAELVILVAVEDVPNQRVMVEVKMNDANCNGTVIFYKASPATVGCQKKKTDGIVGKLLKPLPNSDSCSFDLPVDCDITDGEACQFNGFFAVNGGPVSVQVCKVLQG